ncbi:hypothetical protein AAC387_Pa09g0789 [Persea americana]
MSRWAMLTRTTPVGRDPKTWTLQELLLKTAIRVFAFADKYRRSYSNGLKSYVCPFYCSYSGYQDELLWAVAWLHKATKNPAYLNYIQVKGQTLGVDETDNTFRWDNQHSGNLNGVFGLNKRFSIRDAGQQYAPLSPTSCSSSMEDVITVCEYDSLVVQGDLDHDTVTKVCGRDSRGRF